MIGKTLVKCKKNHLKKKDFYSHLNMEDITDRNFAPKESVCKDFRIRNLRDYYGLYVQNNTLLLAKVFENFHEICLEMYEPDPAHFLSALGLG